jgi:flagella basal body P-ring formation protein FlgA
MATVLDPPTVTRAKPPAPSPSRLSSRARGRLAVGALVVAVGVLLNLAVYRGVNDRTPVLQLARDVPAGQQLAAEDFRSVGVGSDGTFRSVPAAELNALVGSYAKVRLLTGSLLAREALQLGPLVGAGASVVALTVPAGEVPVGVRERSKVAVVLVAADRSSKSVNGVVVGLPTTASSAGLVSVSIEVAAPDAAGVAAAEKVRLVLLDPGGGS